ncbi:hypothetical protein EYF80_015425 [Liparis tanakae]|uniref:Uncharacterized protein n=1 Tax=Liparis tanakae TaxID=230148 RepID=A0A4Z2IAC1_9TELE|nr:hypothetical protein EYF80_015425 [Liparis tanakae]
MDRRGALASLLLIYWGQKIGFIKKTEEPPDLTEPDESSIVTRQSARPYTFVSMRAVHISAKKEKSHNEQSSEIKDGTSYSNQKEHCSILGKTSRCVFGFAVAMQTPVFWEEGELQLIHVRDQNTMGGTSADYCHEMAGPPGEDLHSPTATVLRLSAWLCRINRRVKRQVSPRLPLSQNQRTCWLEAQEVADILGTARTPDHQSNIGGVGIWEISVDQQVVATEAHLHLLDCGHIFRLLHIGRIQLPYPHPSRAARAASSGSSPEPNPQRSGK